MQLVSFLIEGFRQAWHQVMANKLRSFLSLLGISIGIFCIIAVKSAVDSLENNIRGSLEKLGNDVLYISKMPWAENPHENYWKYLSRPNPDHNDFEKLDELVESAEMAAFSVFIGRKLLKYKSNSLDGAFTLGVTERYRDIFDIDFEEGRWIAPFEYDNASNVVILGNNVAEDLFGRINPIGKEIKLSGFPCKVIAVIKKSGKDLINPVDFDRAVIVGYTTARKIANVKSKHMFGSSLMVKAKEGVDMDLFVDEVTGVLRAQRRLRPREKDNFSINQLSILSSILDNFFLVINLAGIAIGFFAILVGMFSVANIMFVSVKERTNIIGVKMALGAKRWFILLEFLIESSIICLFGGLIGLGLVYGVLTTISSLIDFDMSLSIANMSWGMILSIAIGVLSGMLPALMASRLDPVEAMRQ